MLMFVVVPATFCIHLVSVGIALSGYESGMAAIREYFRPATDVSTLFQAGNVHIVSYIYFRSAPYMLVLSGLGVFLACVNALTGGIYLQTGGCTDPLVQTSIASGSYKHVTSQLMWCVDSFGFTCVTTLFVEHSVHFELHATEVQNVLATLAKPDCSQWRSVDQWRSNAGVSVSHLGCHFGRLRFYIFFLLLLMVAALPSIGYVLAQVLCWCMCLVDFGITLVWWCRMFRKGLVGIKFCAAAHFSLRWSK